MGKKTLSFLLILSFLICMLPAPVAYASSYTEMNIYAMYLNSNEKGDSVLLESDGHYLLIDMGTSSHVPAIVRQLLDLGVTNVDVMFSHLHKDHVGGSSTSMLAGLKQLDAVGITVDTLYLPSPNLAPLSLNNSKRYTRLQNYISEKGTGTIVYLSVGSHITFGDVDGEIIGPINTDQLTPQQYASSPGSTITTSGSSIYTSYENNCSLAAIFTCGDTRYFTAGDCMSDEARLLYEHYGSSLKCDIMKLSHHGVSSGNSKEILEAINPAYSFASNTGLTRIDPETNRWKTYASAQRASRHGICYLVGTEKQTLIYHIVNDQITMYRGTTLETGTKMTGWQYLYGADGVNRDHNMYYLDSECLPYTGIQEIDGHYFNFDETGRMEYGSFSNGKYKGWKTYPNGKRYYKLSADKKYAYMSRGFQTINGNKYFFSQNGYRITGTSEDAPTLRLLGSSYYAIDINGVITVSDWLDIDGSTYYFKNDGKMVADQIYKVDSEYFIFDSDGKQIIPDSSPTLYTFKGNTYGMLYDGCLVTDTDQSIGKDKYYFDSKGIMQRQLLIKIGKHQYYFGKSGKLIRNRTFKYKGKTYKANSKGILKLIRK